MGLDDGASRMTPRVGAGAVGEALVASQGGHEGRPYAFAAGATMSRIRLKRSARLYGF